MLPIKKLVIACCFGPLSIILFTFLYSVLNLYFQGFSFLEIMANIDELPILFVWTLFVAYTVTFVFGLPVMCLLLRFNRAHALWVNLIALGPSTLFSLLNSSDLLIWGVISGYSVLVANSCWFIFAGFNYSYGNKRLFNN